MPDTYLPSRLDQAVFGAPFIVIDADNRAHTITRLLDDAARILNTDDAARAIVGTLRPPLLAIDIDPEDTGANADAGDVVAEQLLLWADRYGLPWLRRASGRPGHTHLVIKTPPCLRQELQRVVYAVATRHNVSATVRSTLRLTSSPHRHRLPSPILSCTLRTSDVPELVTSRSPRVIRPPRRRGGSNVSRSEREYGHALALARAGHATAHAWAFANLAGTKAREIGQQAWRRWFWAPATTITAAEDGLTEQHAWDLFQEASPIQAAHLGRDEWRRSRWVPALREAARSRPRRRRLGLLPAARYDREPILGRLRQVQACLRRAVDRCLSRRFNLGTRAGTIAGVRVNSLRAALDALAHALVTTQGSISVRKWAEQARLDPKTVRRARDVALAQGILKRVHHYAGGGADCDAFAITGHFDPEPDATAAGSPTSYTPSSGKADILRLQRQHRQDRIRQQLRLNRAPQCQTKATTHHRYNAPQNHPLKTRLPSPSQHPYLPERKWQANRPRTNPSRHRSDRCVRELQHTNHGQGQLTEQHEPRQQEEQHWNDLSAKLTLTANSTKPRESSSPPPPNEPTSNGLPSSVPEHAAEAQATAGSQDARRPEALAPTRAMQSASDIELALNSARGRRTLPSDLRLLQRSSTMSR